MPFQAPITIAVALERMHRHDYVLPAIQREFVWGPDRICKLFDSLMRGYPVGSFLFWKLDGDSTGRYTFYDFVRNYHAKDAPHCPTLDVEKGAPVTAILDGQQRLTALNIGLRGSYADKLPYKRANNAQAYPVKHLHLDLLHTGAVDDLDLEYRFAFMTATEAAQRDDHHWYPVSEIRSMRDPSEVFGYIGSQQLPVETGKVLFRLWTLVNTDATINFFEEEAQDLERVLNIFIRVNSGAVALSYSDLLLSVATAQWRDRDARQVVHDLVDTLNATGQGFEFPKDLVLKAGLMLMGRGDLRSKVDNFDRQTMLDMEATWDRIESALQLAARVLADFGFSAATLPANSVLLPLAHYVHVRGLDGTWLRRSVDAEDREAVKLWLMRSVLKSGVWGSGLDTLLSGLRRVLDEHGQQGFPREPLEQEMARQGKSLRFEAAEIDDLVDTKYGRKAFPILALLYPHVDLRLSHHIDHVAPRALLRAGVLRKAGLDDATVDTVVDRTDRLPNLQLLEGLENVDKREKWPTEWVAVAYPNEGSRAGYLARNDLEALPVDASDVVRFTDERRAAMRAGLGLLLGVSETDMAATDVPQVPRSDGGGRIAGHVRTVLEGVGAGAVLTVKELSEGSSDYYPADGPRPSRGAVWAGLEAGLPGVETVVNERGVRSGRLRAAAQPPR